MRFSKPVAAIALFLFFFSVALLYAYAAGSFQMLMDRTLFALLFFIRIDGSLLILFSLEGILLILFSRAEKKRKRQIKGILLYGFAIVWGIFLTIFTTFIDVIAGGNL
ncbi:MAG: hypothetical protein LBG22_01190 [Treponema sp.]|nr:hypothetical protein [Treponema sp.]